MPTNKRAEPSDDCRKFVLPHFIVRISPAAKDPGFKLMFQIRRRQFCAVHRNIIKRRIREWFRTRANRPPLDIRIAVREPFDIRNRSVAPGEMAGLVQKAGSLGLQILTP